MTEGVIKTTPAGSAEDVVIDPVRLRRFTREIFEKVGMSVGDAGILAEHLVWADMRGIAALGVAKIPQYLARVQKGGTSTDREPRELSRRGAFLLVDGQDGFGQVVGYKVMKRVAHLARITGIGCAVVRNTTTAGALGRFALIAVEEQMTGLAINNGPVLMGAPDGVEKVIGNQAFAVASPAGKHPPLVLDMATSAMALARMHEYEHKGAELPEGIARTAEGVPTVDPKEALSGIIAPMGGHRGFGLALMWEVLTGVLSGGGITTDIGWPTAADQRQNVSMLLLAIDPEAAMPFTDFTARVDELIDRIHGSRTIVGIDRAVVPGERSAKSMERRQNEGIPLRGELVATLRAIGDDLAVTL
jgi:LDH2 family malate/lactate/ureidoglycolate dehydrogenase